MIGKAKGVNGGRSLSIRDVARRLRVAPSTVSRVLNDRGSNIPISEATRLRVRQGCEDLGYEPNVHARRLFSRRSGVIAVAVPPKRQHPGHYADSCLGRVLSSVSDTAELHGWDLLLVTADEAFLAEKKYLSLFREGSVDGMLIWGALLTDVYVQEMVKEALPVVLLRTSVRDREVPHVVPDDHGGSGGIAQHLLRLGHRDLAYVAGPATTTAAMERQRGFEEACRQSGARLTLYPGDYTYECGLALGAQILRQPDRVTAVAAANDTMALGVMESARQLGLSVPADVSVAGADGAYPMYRPQLTTFEVPEEEIGRRGVGLLWRKVEEGVDWGELRRRGENLVPCRLVPGETTAWPNRKESVRHGRRGAGRAGKRKE